MKRILIAMALMLCLGLSSCQEQIDKAFNTGRIQLEAQGYTDVTSTGQSYCCGEGDNFASGFVAVSSKGDHVKGCICSGFNKGVTIRFQ